MEILQIIWFVLWAVLWITYFALDGFDLGCGMIMNFLAKNENEKRAVINSFGPFWDGNEVWLITAGGATFAAFPSAYADLFSWLYAPLFFVLLALILRGVSFELRGKTENKKVWDIFIFTGSLLPAFLLGAAFGNLWASLPADAFGYSGGTLGLLNFRGLLTGLAVTVFFLMHGLIWIAYKTEGELDQRAYAWAEKAWFSALILFTLFIAFLPLAENPNFSTGSCGGIISVFFYALSAIFLLGVRKKLKAGKILPAFLFSLFFIALFFAGGFAGVFPNLIPSSLSSAYNVSIYNSSSGFYTLRLMTAVALIFVPIVAGYQFWVYKVLRYKVNPAKPETLRY